MLTLTYNARRTSCPKLSGYSYPLIDTTILDCYINSNFLPPDGQNLY